MKSRIFPILIMCLAVIGVDRTQAQTDPGPESASSSSVAAEFETRVRAISSGATSENRMAALVTLLDGMEVKYKIESFEAGRRKGKNLIINLGPEVEDRICIGAHFDQVRVGQGAVDNACSCAALIELIEQFEAKPLQNFCLEVVFFDLEEMGLLGSRAYVADRKPEQLPDYFINLDIFGYGDTIWLMAVDSNGLLQKAFEHAGNEAKIPVVTSGMKQYPPSDHIPFAEASVPTVGVALIDQPEIKVVQSLLAGEHVDMPPILRIIHTPDDTMEMVKPKQSARAIPVVEAVIRWLDDQAKK